jgi:hypothetical protein
MGYRKWNYSQVPNIQQTFVNTVTLNLITLPRKLSVKWGDINTGRGLPILIGLAHTRQALYQYSESLLLLPSP